ncbi:50S ribosomal protein L15 [Methanomicrobiaceae archaeon CYW5]|uniref:uL15m family ribosomal protein n=1 Tax=Methanovulcanius yangii TaxID=1789227 RepID=UPI0029CA0D61|nr:uL15m family ribosomal protein [Methanovulcanius yangii]MBT8508008.1 50S ribosomal protein L15 [Methanovulcanius yangii]
MPVNKRSKYRGSRTCGGGTSKNRRGAGNRGGRGRAGHRDHRFSHFLIANDVHNGKHGFVNKNPSRLTALDIGEIDQMADDLVATGKAALEGDVIVIDAGQIGIDKILGGGQVTKKMNISALSVTDRARQKIEENGGQILEA